MSDDQRPSCSYGGTTPTDLDNTLVDLLSLLANFTGSGEVDETVITQNLVNFSTKTVEVNVVNKARSMDRRAIVADVYRIIRFYVQLGDDLEYMQKQLSPLARDELIGLVRKYDLVSAATDGKSMTLSRVCESFPAQTCVYQCVIPSPLVPVELMQTVVKNYPRMLMTTAFAYFIPNKDLEYCTLVKQAHMLYRYCLYFITRRGMAYRKVDEVIVSFEMIVVPDVVEKSLQYTHAAIIRSEIPYEKQMLMLTTTKLVTVEHTMVAGIDTEIVTVSEVVRAAAKVWVDFILRNVDISAMEENLRAKTLVWESEKQILDVTYRAQ